MTDTIEILAATDDYLHAAVGPVFLLVWRGETTSAGVNATEAAMEKMAKMSGDRFGLLTVVEPNAPLPPGEVRDQLAALLGRLPWITASAVVFEGKGFRAAAVRSVVTGLTLLAKQPYPHKVFGTTEEGTQWLLSTMNLGPSAIAASKVLNEVRKIRAQVEGNGPAREGTRP